MPSMIPPMHMLSPVRAAGTHALFAQIAQVFPAVLSGPSLARLSPIRAESLACPRQVSHPSTLSLLPISHLSVLSLSPVHAESLARLSPISCPSLARLSPVSCPSALSLSPVCAKSLACLMDDDTHALYPHSSLRYIVLSLPSFTGGR